MPRRSPPTFVTSLHAFSGWVATTSASCGAIESGTISCNITATSYCDIAATSAAGLATSYLQHHTCSSVAAASYLQHCSCNHTCNIIAMRENCVVTHSKIRLKNLLEGIRASLSCSGTDFGRKEVGPFVLCFTAGLAEAARYLPACRIYAVLGT